MSATREDIARATGFSPSTVTRALNDHPAIPEATRKKVKGCAKKMGYHPSQLGRSYYQGKSYRLGVLVPFTLKDGVVRSTAQEYFSRFIYGAASAAEKLKYSVNIIPDTGLSARDLEGLVQTRSVDGLVFLGARIGDTRFDRLFRNRVPFILIHHYQKARPYLYLDTDSYAGFKELFQHLKSKGVRTVSHLSGGNDLVNGVDRKAIFLRLADEFDLKVTGIIDGDFSRTSGTNAADLFSAKKFPDVIICANDRMAFGLIKGLKDRGIRIPEDVRISGFDNLELATLIEPGLTTIGNPFTEIGQKAADKLIALINGDTVKSEKVPAKLILRDSA